MGQVLSCETGLIPRCRSHSVEEKATSSHGEWLAWEEPRAVGDLVHVEKFFARNLGGLIHARTRVPGRLGKATSRTPSMYVDEKSVEAIVLAKRLNKGRQLPAEVVEGRASPKGGARCVSSARRDLMEWTGRAPSALRLKKSKIVSICSASFGGAICSHVIVARRAPSPSSLRLRLTAARRWA